MISFTMSGGDSVTTEYNEFKSDLRHASTMSLHAMYGDLVTRLQGNINKYYDEYDPKEYKRRKDYPQHGIPIISEEYMSPIEKKDAGGLVYYPEGAYFDENGELVDYLSIRNGDELIEWFSTPHGDIPARPLWNWFTLDLIEGGGADELFVQNLKVISSEVFNTLGVNDIAVTGNVKRENDDVFYGEMI